MSEDNSERAAELIERIRKQDGDALAEYCTLFQRQLLAFIDRQMSGTLRKKVEPEDIFQETAAEAVRSLPQMDLSEREPFSWLCQVAERRIIDAHRRFFEAKKRDAGKEVALGSPGGDSDHPGLVNMLVVSMTTPSAAFSRNAREARLQDAINKLPEDQREAIRLRYIENLPSKEIAERLGKTDAAVRVMLTRSLKKLQDLMGVW